MHPSIGSSWIVGYFDYEWQQHGIIVDLKTTEKLPSSIKIPHARQVALYASNSFVGSVANFQLPSPRLTMFPYGEPGRPKSALT
jgi:hypothetical protein